MCRAEFRNTQARLPDRAHNVLDDEFADSTLEAHQVRRLKRRGFAFNNNVNHQILDLNSARIFFWQPVTITFCLPPFEFGHRILALFSCRE